MAQADDEPITDAKVIPFPAPTPPELKMIWVQVEERLWRNLLDAGRECRSK